MNTPYDNQFRNIPHRVVKLRENRFRDVEKCVDGKKEITRLKYYSLPLLLEPYAGDWDNKPCRAMRLSLTCGLLQEKRQGLCTLFYDERGVRVSVADLARVDAGVFHRQTLYQQRLSLPVFAARLITATQSADTIGGGFNIHAGPERRRPTVKRLWAWKWLLWSPAPPSATKWNHYIQQVFLFISLFLF